MNVPRGADAVLVPASFVVEKESLLIVKVVEDERYSAPPPSVCVVEHPLKCVLSSVESPSVNVPKV